MIVLVFQWVFSTLKWIMVSSNHQTITEVIVQFPLAGRRHTFLGITLAGGSRAKVVFPRLCCLGHGVGCGSTGSPSCASGGLSSRSPPCQRKELLVGAVRLHQRKLGCWSYRWAKKVWSIITKIIAVLDAGRTWSPVSWMMEPLLLWSERRIDSLSLEIH